MTGPAQAGDRIRLIRPEFRLSKTEYARRIARMAMDSKAGWKIASLALGALAALLALHLVWSLLRAPGGGAEAGSPVAVPEPFRWPSVDASLWRLFRSGEPAAVSSVPGALSSRYRLAGAFLVLAEGGRLEGAPRCAILDDLQDRQQHLAMEGEWVGGVRVVRVESDHVVLSDGEREEVVVLAAGTLEGNEGQPVAAGAPAPEAPAVLETNRFGNRIGETRWEVRREAVLQYYQEMMDSPERLASLFLAMKADRDGEGRIDGYRLDMTFGEKDFYSQVGFQDGDIVRKANSMRMTSQRRAEYFIGEFVQGRLDTVVIDIERNGEPKKLIYLVK